MRTVLMAVAVAMLTTGCPKQTADSDVDGGGAPALQCEPLDGKWRAILQRSGQASSACPQSLQGELDLTGEKSNRTVQYSADGCAVTVRYTYDSGRSSMTFELYQTADDDLRVLSVAVELTQGAVQCSALYSATLKTDSTSAQ